MACVPSTVVSSAAAAGGSRAESEARRVLRGRQPGTKAGGGRTAAAPAMIPLQRTVLRRPGPSQRLLFGRRLLNAAAAAKGIGGGGGGRDLQRLNSMLSSPRGRPKGRALFAKMVGLAVGETVILLAPPYYPY